MADDQLLAPEAENAHAVTNFATSLTLGKLLDGAKPAAGAEVAHGEFKVEEAFARLAAGEVYGIPAGARLRATHQQLAEGGRPQVTDSELLDKKGQKLFSLKETTDGQRNFIVALSDPNNRLVREITSNCGKPVGDTMTCDLTVTDGNRQKIAEGRSVLKLSDRDRAITKYELFTPSPEHRPLGSVELSEATPERVPIKRILDVKIDRK